MGWGHLGRPLCWVKFELRSAGNHRVSCRDIGRRRSIGIWAASVKRFYSTPGTGKLL